MTAPTQKKLPKDYGTYVVRVTVAQDDSHTEAVVTKEFSITKKRMTLTAEDYSGTYDGQKHAITVTVTDTEMWRFPIGLPKTRPGRALRLRIATREPTPYIIR